MGPPRPPPPRPPPPFRPRGDGWGGEVPPSIDVVALVEGGVEGGVLEEPSSDHLLNMAWAVWTWIESSPKMVSTHKLSSVFFFLMMVSVLRPTPLSLV